MRTHALVLALACAGCLGSADDGQSCWMAACPAAGAASYSLCAIPNGCGYRTSDGTLFACASCSDCTAAAARTMQWCQAQATSTTTSTGTCASCISGAESGSCAASLAACQADAGCAALASCAGACNGDASCLANCRAQASTTAAQKLGAFSECVSSACASDCGASGADGGTASGGNGGTGGGGGVMTNACAACAVSAAKSSCASTAHACSQDAACVALQNCVDACSDSTCANDCYAGAPTTAVDENDAFGACVCNQCSGECAQECA